MLELRNQMSSILGLLTLQAVISEGKVILLEDKTLTRQRCPSVSSQASSLICMLLGWRLSLQKKDQNSGYKKS